GGRTSRVPHDLPVNIGPIRIRSRTSWILGVLLTGRATPHLHRVAAGSRGVPERFRAPQAISACLEDGARWATRLTGRVGGAVDRLRQSPPFHAARNLEPIGQVAKAPLQATLSQRVASTSTESTPLGLGTRTIATLPP